MSSHSAVPDRAIFPAVLAVALLALGSEAVAAPETTLTLLSPTPTQTLRGTVECTVALSNGPPAALLFFLDGRLIHQAHDVTRTSVRLNTTELANGIHQLRVVAWLPQPESPPLAMLQVPLRVDNGRALRSLRPRCRDLWLQPGDTAHLTARLVFTDSTEKPLARGLRFRCADPSVATVDDRGRVTARQPGITAITLAGPPGEATVRVIVSPTRCFPHFSRHGLILTNYDPQQSLFVRALFHLTPREVAARPELATRLRDAAVNALTSGFYFVGGATNFPSWRQHWEPWWQRIERDAATSGFAMVLTGDDIARTRSALATSLTNEWTAAAIQHALATVRDSRRVISIEMVDEVSFLWGNTPRPTDGRWARHQPPLPDDAFVRLMHILHAVTNRPPLTWPVGGIADEQTARNWMGDPFFSDYATHYWDVTDWRDAHPTEGASLPQYRAALDRVMIGRASFLPQERPVLLLTGICGEYYRKQGFGDRFLPGRDRLIAQGPGPVAVAAQILYAAATGAAGVRVYAYDAWWNRERQTAVVGQPVQTGADPFSVGTDRWQAMATVFRLIERLEPHLLQPSLSAMDLGPDFVTGARQGPSSRLFIAINFSELPQTVRLDLGPYRYRNARAVARYRLRGARLETDHDRTPDGAPVTFAPGETMVWSFRPRIPPNEDHLAPAVRWLRPLPDSIVDGMVIVEAAATDDRRVVRVEFAVNDRVFATRTRPPFRADWDSATVPAGVWHALSATAYDAAGNFSEARCAIRPRMGCKEASAP